MADGARRITGWLLSGPGWIRLGLALAFPLIATIVALPLRRADATSAVAALVYLLAVVAAALVGGLRGGLASSVISFLGLNFFFTPPFHTFEVEKAEDIVALFVFLIVSAIVANLFTQALGQRARAERREHETSLLYRLASRLLGRESLGGVLDEFAEDVVRLFDLARCEVRISSSEETKVQGGHFQSGPSFDEALGVEIPMRTEREEFGIVRVIPKTTGAFGDQERELAQAFVSQMALAVESIRLQEKTRSAQAEAEGSRIRAALFSSVTHDLRTPLSSIKASATSLLEEGVSFDASQREELLRTIAEESDRLNRLIGNLLDLSRLRAGALVPEKVPTPIDEVIEGVVSRMGRILDGLRIDIRIKDGIPPVPIDVLQIDQVLSNLLENAARYSPDDSEIQVRASKWQSSVEIEVADRGPGIPPEDRERVFQEFFRGGSEDRRGGAGLGLSIARAIVAAHGGSMRIHETPGGGATVGFSLPTRGGQDRGD
jgi:two-component system sensor histidine kinase KdpD